MVYALLSEKVRIHVVPRIKDLSTNKKVKSYNFCFFGPVFNKNPKKIAIHISILSKLL